MEISFKYLLQMSRLLTDKIYNDNDLIKMYNFILSIDNSELNEYLLTKTLFSYENDLELYLEVLKNILKIFEETENYELCIEIKKKIDDCQIIINKNKQLTNE